MPLQRTELSWEIQNNFTAPPTCILILSGRDETGRYRELFTQALGPTELAALIKELRTAQRSYERQLRAYFDSCDRQAAREAARQGGPSSASTSLSTPLCSSIVRPCSRL